MTLSFTGECMVPGIFPKRIEPESLPLFPIQYHSAIIGSIYRATKKRPRQEAPT